MTCQTSCSIGVVKYHKYFELVVSDRALACIYKALGTVVGSSLEDCLGLSFSQYDVFISQPATTPGAQDPFSAFLQMSF